MPQTRAWWTLSTVVWLCVGCTGASDPLTDADASSAAADTSRPNIVLIVADDGSLPEQSRVRLDRAVQTLAKEGVRFSNTTSVGTASTMPSALLTGMHPVALGLDPTSGAGGDSHRHADPMSENPSLKGAPPQGMRVFPELLRAAGYYTVRSGEARHGLSVISDTTPAAWTRRSARPAQSLLGAWDAAGPGLDWRRAPAEPCTVAFGCGGYPGEQGSPFFVQVNIPHESGDAVDEVVADILDKLESDGLTNDTVVLLASLAGTSPMVAKWPGRIEAGSLRDEPVTLLDLAPTILALAQAPIPSYVNGRVVLGQLAATAPTRTVASDVSSEKSIVEPWVGGTAPVAATPRGYPTGGVFHVAPRVELSCGTEGSSMVYSTELAAPFYWRLYTGPFRMRFWTLRFQCGRLGYANSPVVTYDFDIE